MLKYKKILRRVVMKALYTNLEDDNYQMLEMLSGVKGVKKNYIVNEALRYYFNVIKTIPEEFILKPITITEEEYERIEKESQPTKALQRLIRGN